MVIYESYTAPSGGSDYNSISRYHNKIFDKNCQQLTFPNILNSVGGEYLISRDYDKVIFR